MLTGTLWFADPAPGCQFCRPRAVIVATTFEEVCPALDEVSRCVGEGAWAAGFLTYEAAPAFDRALTTHASGPLPLMWFGIYSEATFCPFPWGDGGPRGALEWQPAVSEPEYKAGVQRLKELIAAGDTYQANLCFPLESSFEGDPAEYFRAMQDAQEARYSAYLDIGAWKILSASPELFFRLDGTRIVTRPMKGTRPRGRWTAEDRRFARDLEGSEKDRAENVMIVDLLRNDLGRISETGSVEVESLFDIERYPTVWQMTSTIAAETHASVPEILRALFPCGSVTGAPKVRTMEIIRELERRPRGVYCGAIGWWRPDRVAQFSVAIRTMTIDTRAKTATYSVGSGITWDSRADDEYAECLAKARVVMSERPPFELLETMRLEDGMYFLLDRHRERLLESADYFGFKVDWPAIEATLDELRADLAAGGTAYRVRLTVNRSGNHAIETAPLPETRVFAIGLAKHPVDERDVFLFHKTTRRSIYDSARALRPNCDDVVLWNPRRLATESMIGNLVVEIGGARFTPPIGDGLLGGVFRAELLDRKQIAERSITIEELETADRVYIVNSVRKWIETRWVDEV